MILNSYSQPPCLTFTISPYLPTEEFFRKFTLICLITRSKQQNSVWFSLKVCILCLFKEKRTVGLNRRNSKRVRVNQYSGTLIGVKNTFTIRAEYAFLLIYSAYRARSM